MAEQELEQDVQDEAVAATSAAPSGNSGTAAAGVDEDALLGELQTLYKEPSKHMKRILEIQKALGK
jgi:hypothetical protein